MSRMLRFLAVLLALAAAVPAPARADGDHDRARRARAAGEIAGLDRLLSRIAAEQQGRVIDVELERSRGRYVYEVKLLTPDGRRRKVRYDAVSLDPIVR